MRPLELGELAEIFAIDMDETPRFDPERRLPESRAILTMCSSLIMLEDATLHASDGEYAREPNEGSQDFDADSVVEYTDSEKAETYIRLAHFSVQEFLLSDRIQHGAARHYSIREVESHGVLAEDCLAYLLQFDERGSLTHETFKLSPLADYAAKFWFGHAKLAEKRPIKTTTLLSMELLMADGEGFLNWIRIHDLDEDGWQDLSRGPDD